MANDDLFVQVLAQIERDPDHWSQSNWAYRTECGTTLCFAGHAAVLTGAELTFSSNHALTGSTDRGHIKLVAADALGIGWSEVEELFYKSISLDDLYEASAFILGLDEQVLRDKVQAEVAHVPA